MKTEQPTTPPESASSNCYALEPRPWWKRFCSRFFHWHPLAPELPAWAKDGIVVHTSVNFCWKDRLRILLTGNVSVRTWTACENLPGRVETKSSAVAPLENA